MLKKTAFDGYEFVERLRELGRKKGLKTQKAVGEYLGVEDRIGNWKRGTSTPTIEDLIHIASMFKCSVDNLLGVNNQIMDCAALLRTVRILDLNTFLEIHESDSSLLEDGVKRYSIDWTVREIPYSGLTKDLLVNPEWQDRYGKTLAIGDFLGNYSKLREVALDNETMEAAVEGIIKKSCFSYDLVQNLEIIPDPEEGQDDGEH